MRVLHPLRPTCALALGLALAAAGPATAQSWETNISDNGGYAAGAAYVPNIGFGIGCFARSVQNLPLIDTGWHEADIAPPWHVNISIGPQLIPATTQIRDDIVIYVGDTGYRLPQIGWNELDGGWNVDLPMTDGLMQSLPAASRLVLAVGAEAAWELPVAGLEGALRRGFDHCAATWTATGIAAPPGIGVAQAAIPAPAQPATPQAGFAIPPQVQAYANQHCNGFATIGPNAMQAGDLDADGTPDVVLNWNDVRCNGESFRGFCGAANCEHTLFFSTKGYNDPFVTLAIQMELVPHASGRLGMRSYSTACSQPGTDCDKITVWNGSRFTN